MLWNIWGVLLWNIFVEYICGGGLFVEYLGVGGGYCGISREGFVVENLEESLVVEYMDDGVIVEYLEVFVVVEYRGGGCHCFGISEAGICRISWV